MVRENSSTTEEVLSPFISQKLAKDTLSGSPWNVIFHRGEGKGNSSSEEEQQQEKHPQNTMKRDILCPFFTVYTLLDRHES